MVARRESRSSGRSERGGGGRGGGRGDRDRGSERSRGRERDEPEARDRDRDRDRGDDRGSRRNDRDRDDRRDRRTPARSGGGSSYVYKPRDPADVKRRAEAKRGGSFDSIFKQGFDTLTLAQGDNTIRILPPTWANHDDCAFVIWTHNYVGADESTYLCPRKMNQDHCPICVEAKAAKDDGDEDDWKHLRPQQRAALWVIDRDDKADPPTPMLYNMYYGQWQDILKVSWDRKKGSVLDIDDPDNGFDLFISRTGQGARTRYSGFSFDREPSPIDEDSGVQEDIMKFVEDNPIPSVLNFFDADYLEKVIKGTTPERDQDAEDGRDDPSDDDPPPRRGSRRDDPPDDDPPEERRGRGRGRRDDPPDDDPPDDPPEERRGRGRRDDPPDDDPPPRRGSRRDDPPDDDPPPRRGSRRDDPPDDDPPDDRRGRGRRDDPPDDDPPPPRRGGRERSGGKSEGRRYRD